MKYFSAPAPQMPIMSEDKNTVIGFDLMVHLLSGGQSVEYKARYEMDEADWFPFQELSQRVAEATYKGHTLLGTFEAAEAEMDLKLAQA